MARRVFLHIGEMKTGTSYVQQVGELNAQRLAEEGLLWVAGTIRYDAVRDLLGRMSKADAPGGNTWRRLVRQVNQHDGDVMIVNELIAGGGTRSVRTIVHGFRHVELNVVITVRDPAQLIPSHWQTTIKGGKTVGWNDFAAAVCSDGTPAGDEDAPSGDAAASDATRLRDWFWKVHDVTTIFAQWQQVVPLDRITVVTVPPTGTTPEIVVGRIGSVLGIPMTGLEQPETLVNSSLGAHSAELMRQLNLEYPGMATEKPYGYRGALGGALIATRAGLEPRFALSPEQQGWVRNRARMMIAGIETSGVRVEGDLAELVPAEHPPSDVVDPAEATERELLQAASGGLIGMVLNAVELRQEGDELGHQVEALTTERDKLLRRVERQQKRIDGLVADERARPATARSWQTGVRARLGRNPVVRRTVARLRRAVR